MPPARLWPGARGCPTHSFRRVPSSPTLSGQHLLDMLASHPHLLPTLIAALNGDREAIISSPDFPSPHVGPGPVAPPPGPKTAEQAVLAPQHSILATLLPAKMLRSFPVHSVEELELTQLSKLNLLAQTPLLTVPFNFLLLKKTTLPMDPT